MYDEQRQNKMKPKNIDGNVAAYQKGLNCFLTWNEITEQNQFMSKLVLVFM